MTIGVFWGAHYLGGKPSMGNKSLETLINVMFTMAIPTILLFLIMLTRGKWEGIYFLSALVNVIAISVFTGYKVGRAMQKDAFELAVTFGLISLIVAGGPLAAYFLP
jgi:hypothetical protein